MNISSSVRATSKKVVRKTLISPSFYSTRAHSGAKVLVHLYSIRYALRLQVVSTWRARSAWPLLRRRGQPQCGPRAAPSLPGFATLTDPGSAAEWSCATAAPHTQDRSLRGEAIPVRRASAPEEF